MSSKSRTRHLAAVGQQVVAPSDASNLVCPSCLRQLARAALYPLDGAVLDLYLDVRRGDGIFSRLGPLDHAATMRYLSTFVAALDSAGEHYWRCTQLESAAYDEGLTDDEDAELTEWEARRDAWRAEPDEAVAGEG